MDDQTRRYQPGQEDEPMELNDVLEPYRGPEDGADRFAADGGDYDPYAYEEDENEDFAYDEDESDGYGAEEDEAVEDAWEHEGRVRTTMGVLNTFSVLLGVFVIFLLVAMLLGLCSWLKADILHSLTLLEGGIR